MKTKQSKLFACYFTVLNVYINYLSNLTYLQFVSKIISKNCVTSVVYLAPFLHIFEFLVSRMLGTFIYFLFLSVSLNYFVYSTSFSLNDFKSLGRATCFSINFIVYLFHVVLLMTFSYLIALATDSKTNC